MSTSSQKNGFLATSEEVEELPVDEEMYEVFFPGSLNKNKIQNDVIVITGGKGLGKTTLAKYLVRLYHKFNPKNKIFVLSGVRSSYPKYTKFININKISDESPPIELFKNSLVVFDDWENHPESKIGRMLENLVNVIAQNGRNYKISLVVILHHLNKGFKSTTLLREMDALIIFPEKFDNNVFNTLLNHFGLTKHLARSLFNKSRFVLIRNSSPFYYFVSNERKKFDLK
jgi:predicted AAA+ superfamily ATPase